MVLTDTEIRVPPSHSKKARVWSVKEVDSLVESTRVDRDPEKTAKSEIALDNPFVIAKVEPEKVTVTHK